MAIYELSCDVGLTLSDVITSSPEAQVAQIAVEVLSDSDTISIYTQVAQIAVETLSKQDRIVNYTQVAQIAVETLSKQDRVVNYTQVAQIAIEVLSKSVTRWPHNFCGVPNASIASIIQPGVDAWTSVMGTTL